MPIGRIGILHQARVLVLPVGIRYSRSAARSIATGKRRDLSSLGSTHCLLDMRLLLLASLAHVSVTTPPILQGSSAPMLCSGA